MKKVLKMLKELENENKAQRKMRHLFEKVKQQER